MNDMNSAAYECIHLALHKYYSRDFIDSDPISVPHLFSYRPDIEIAAFLTSILSWGSRKSILKSARYLMQLLENDPHRFVLHHSVKDLQNLRKFYYRTFQPADVEYFIKFLKKIYTRYPSLEDAFFPDASAPFSVEKSLIHFRKLFLGFRPPMRTEKHIPDIQKGSAAKRLCMLFRWMIRKCPKEIDFGLWNKIPPSELKIPLDVHTHRALYGLGIVPSKHPRWKHVLQVSGLFQRWNPEDPCLYDFALFGLGMEFKHHRIIF